MRNRRETRTKAVVEEICYKPREVKPWLIIFHLPSEPVWYVALFIMNYLAVLEALFSSVNNKCLEGRFKTIILIPDIVYVVDLILVVLVQLVTKIQSTTSDIAKRPLWVIFCDIYSLIPQELLYSGGEYHYCLMRVNRVFRVFKLSYMIYKSYNSLNRHILMYVVDFSLTFTLFGFITYCIYCNSVCTVGECVGTACDAPDFLKGIIGSMQNIFERKIEDEQFYIMVQGFFVFTVVTMGFFFRAFVSVHQIHRAAHQHTYMYRYKIMKHRHNRFNLPEYIKVGANKGYKLYWQQNRGYRHSKGSLTILSPVMSSEVLIDISWPALKHSKLFRGMELPVLREVSTYMKQIHVLPGEIIYRKSQSKTKMIYVVSGIISILSDEDGESPIISFTSGTIIGELSLFVTTKSTNVLRCKTFCQLHVLEQRDFLRISSKFPVAYGSLRSMIYGRLEYAKECDEIVSETKRNLGGVRRDIDVYTIVWLKNILHSLMSTSSEAAYRHDFQNINLMDTVKQGNLKYVLFSANNLDMLAIAERIEKSQDANFARLKFPYIIHSTSIILNLWEIFIVAWTLLLSFIIPYMVFVSTSLPMWYKPLVLIGTFIFMLDIYIQISTTIKTTSDVLSTVTTITIKRFQTVGFWLDLFSCLPFEVFTPMVIKELTSNSMAAMHINRVLKIWRIWKLFEAWMHSSTAVPIFIIFLKYTWILSYVTFSIFMYLRSENPWAKSLDIIFISSQWSRNLDCVIQGYQWNSTVRPVINEFVFIIILAFYGSVAFIHVIQHFNLVKVQQVSFDVLSMMKKHKLRSYANRAVDFLLAQWHSNFCYYLHKNYLDQVYFSKTMLTETIDAMYGDTIRDIPLFRCFCDSFSYDASNLMKVFIFPPREVISYYGCVTCFVYIMFRGTCELLNEKGEVVKCVTGIHCCNLLEVMLRTPNTHTFRAVTHCTVLRFDRVKLLRKLFRYENDSRFFTEVLQSCDDIRDSLMSLSRLKATTLIQEYVKKENFFVYPSSFVKDSYEEYDFYIPYDRLYPFAFLRYFFLRRTIYPDGWFLYTWQLFRSCVALLTGICYFTPIIIVDYPWILHTLDTLGLLNIYVRLHVCYFNDRGILVTHPLETARNYWRNGFLIDFISVIPLRYAFSIDYDWSITVINSNHLLQLHTYLHLMNDIKSDIIKPRSKWFSLFYIPFIMAICTVLGLILFTSECTISSDSSLVNGIYIGYTCTPDSILESSPYSKPISLVRAHLYYVYVGTSLMTNVSYGTPVINSEVAKCVFMIAMLVSLYISVKLISQMQELHCFRKGDLLENQIAMRHLKKFLDKTVGDSNLRKVVIRTCELKWLRLRGQGALQVVQPFTLALRSDILYEFYGKTLYNTSPFKKNASHFYKNLLPLLKFDLIVKGGYLETINDIDDHIYVLYQGIADVLTPDGNTLQTLRAGSIYGNILNRDRSRLKLSIVAMTHVEVLLCRTKTFMNLLRYYPEALEDFENLRAKYVYYVPSKSAVASFTEGKTKRSSGNLFTKVFEPNCYFVRVWNFLFLSIACYACIIIDIYQMGSADYSYLLVTVQYLSDLMYLAHFLLQDRIAYENEWGYMVYDLVKIKQKNRENKIMLVITIIGMLPIDIVIYSLSVTFFDQTGFNSFYRLNRFLRIVCLIHYIKIKSKKLDVSIFLMRLLSLCAWAFMTVQIYATTLAWFSCSFTPNLTPEIPSWADKAHWNSSAAFKLQLSFVYTVWAAFSASVQTTYVPQGDVHIALFIFTMISGYYCYMTACCEVFSMVNEFYVKKGQYLQLYHHIKYFLFTQNVSASLRMKCLSICSDLWTSNEGEMFPRLLDEVSPYLRDAVMNCAFSSFVGGHPIFEKCHKDFVRQVVQKVRYRIYNPGEYVQFKGAVDRTMYFVFKGEVLVLIDEYMNNDKIVEVLYKGNSFGIKEGLNKMTPHSYSYRCKTTVTILSLYLYDWNYLLTHFPASKVILSKHR